MNVLDCITSDLKYLLETYHMKLSDAIQLLTYIYKEMGLSQD